jgi:hypothetical protein
VDVRRLRCARRISKVSSQLLQNKRGINMLDLSHILDRAMAQAVIRRPVTAEARVRSRVIPCGICGGQSGTGTGFSPSTSIFPCQFHSTGAPIHRKPKNLIIFITGFCRKPQGCGASVASAAGPFTKNATFLTEKTRGDGVVNFYVGQ